MDETCIAPKFSHIYGNFLNWIFGCGICGCHRFDQDALTILNSFFFGITTNINQYPAYALTPEEATYFDINRRTVKKYIQDQLKYIIWEVDCMITVHCYVKSKKLYNNTKQEEN